MLYAKGVDMKAVEHLEAALKKLEDDRDDIVSMIGGLRTLIAKAKNGAEPDSKRTGEGKKGFERKYEKPARELVDAAIPEGGPAVTIGQISAALEARGYVFKRGTVNLNIRHLLQDEAIVQEKAPKGSGFTYAYRKILAGSIGPRSATTGKGELMRRRPRPTPGRRWCGQKREARSL